MPNPAAQVSPTGLEPAAHRTFENGLFTAAVSGCWTLSYLLEAEAAAKALAAPDTGVTRVAIDLDALKKLDTAGALALIKLRQRLGGDGKATFSGGRDNHRALLSEVERSTIGREPERAVTPLTASLAAVSGGVSAFFGEGYRLTLFLGEVATAVGRIALRPRRFRWTAFVHQLQQTGLSAVPIVALVCFLIGGVVMQQGAQQLRAFGAETMSIDMLAILTLREVGVLLTAVMVAGRSASAFTAQIGTMKMREEIDAMRTIGIDPMETLVVPRILALLVALPLLVFIADAMALAGGALMAKLYLNLDLPIYLQRLGNAISAKHFYAGLIKAPFAALVIGLVGCLEGLSVTGSAESVGTQVTRAVVKAIFLVLILDGVFAIFLSASGF